jgi:hypothetical protein
MGVSLDKEAWGCLRNLQHRGRAAYSLIAALLGCNFNQARTIADQYTKSDPDKLPELSFDKPIKIKPGTMELPHEAQEIYLDNHTARFWKFVRLRGFPRTDEVIAQYGLRACTAGRWQGRVIIPVYNPAGGLLGWQGRYIYGRAYPHIPRYLSEGDLKSTVYNVGVPADEVLFICEGPFDAIKVDFYGQEMGARAVCTFGTTFTEVQVQVLRSIAKRFSRTVLLFDRDAIEPTYQLRDWLGKCEVGEVPGKDPGELSETQVKSLIEPYL